MNLTDLDHVGIAVDDLDATLGAVLKVREDVDRVRERKVLEGV